MKQTSIAIAIMALAASSPAFAAGPNVQGGSSVPGNVAPGASTLSPLDPTNTGNAGISMQRPGGAMSATVDILGAPIQQATNPVLVDANGNRWARHPGDGQIIAQVWAYTPSGTDANVYSLRQVRQPGAPMPVFGGLVIGQVKNAAGVALPAEQGVYFGEWSEQSSPTGFPTPSTDLNMGSARRTVWYAGDNAVISTPQLVSVTYSVTGIQNVGNSSGNLPSAPDLYSGTLTTNYANAGQANAISGTIANSGNSVGLSAAIDSNGTFTGANTQGRFYNGATALAGIYTGGSGAADDIAFGGHQTGGSINPLP